MLSREMSVHSHRRVSGLYTISEQSLAHLSDWLQKRLAVPPDMK